MSPKLKKEKLVHINREHFKKALLHEGKSQKEIAENVCYTSEAYFSRKLSQGIISKEWLFKMADYLNISRSYLSGDSNVEQTRLAEERNELSEMGQRRILNKFMISRGFEDSFCDDLTETDLTNIEYFIALTTKYHTDIISDMVGYDVSLEKHIAQLEKRISILEDNNSSGS